MVPKNVVPLQCLHLLFVQIFYLPLSLWRNSFLGFFHLKFSAYKINGLTFSLVCIHDKSNIIFVWEILYGTNNMTRYFSNLARKNIWCKKTIQSENDSACMIFLAYRHVRYIKTSIWLKPSILLLWYHLRKARQKNITQKEIKFPFGWCSWIFDLTSDGQDTTIIKFNHESFQVYSITTLLTLRFEYQISKGVISPPVKYIF